MKRTVGIWILALAFFLPACQKKDNPERASKDLTVIFATTTGMVGDCYNELIISAVMESVKAQPDVTVHLMKPDNLTEARSQFNDWRANADEGKALILCGPEFEPLVEGVNLQAGRILLLDSDKTYGEGIATAQLKRYGGAWLVGALLKDFELRLLKGLDGDRIIDVISQGIEDGYKENGGTDFQKYVLSTGYEGLNMADELYGILMEKEVVDMPDSNFKGIFVPVCGASRLGAFTFSRRQYWAFVGIGEDCSSYSDFLPFSLILDLGGILKEYVSGWAQNNPWPAHADFGLATGHVRISFSERFYYHELGKADSWPLSLSEWRALEDENKQKALEKEAGHAY